MADAHEVVFHADDGVVIQNDVEGLEDQDEERLPSAPRDDEHGNNEREAPVEVGESGRKTRLETDGPDKVEEDAF